MAQGGLDPRNRQHFTLDNDLKGRSQSYMEKPLSWLETSRPIYTRKQPSTLQATWRLNANMVAIFDEWWKPKHAPPWWHRIEPQLRRN